MEVYSILVLVVILCLVVILLLNFHADKNIEFTSETQYYNYVSRNKNKYIYVQPATRKYFFKENYPLIEKKEKQVLYLNIDDYVAKVNFIDLIILRSEDFKIKLCFKVSSKFKVAFKDLQLDDIYTWDLKDKNFLERVINTTNKDDYEIIVDESKNNDNVTIDLNIVTDFNQFINGYKLKQLTFKNLTTNIDLIDIITDTVVVKDSKDFTLTNVNCNKLYFVDCELQTVNYNCKQITIHNCIILNTDFNQTTNYNIKHTQIENESEIELKDNVVFEYYYENIFKLLPLGTQVMIDDVKYFINSYFKYCDKTFFYYTGINMETNEVIYFNPLTLNNQQHRLVKENIPLLKYYSKYLPERNRADTYNKRIEKNTMSYKITYYDDALKPYLKYFGLIDDIGVDAKKVSRFDILFMIEYYVLKQIDDIEQIVEFYEKCFNPKLLESRLKFFLLPNEKTLYYFDNITIDVKESKTTILCKQAIFKTFEKTFENNREILK